ncbi:MAG: TRAP transporter small permease subunit [Pseudomonadota bacterium]
MTDQPAIASRILGAGRAALRWALGLLLIAMVLLNVANAAGRYLFGRAIAGADELLVFSMVWLVFAGVVLVTAEGRHLRLDLGQSLFSGRLGAFRAALINLMIAVLCFYVALQSWEIIGRLGQIGQRSMALGIPMVVPHAAIAIGLAATALVALLLAFGQVRRIMVPDSGGDREI